MAKVFSFFGEKTISRILSKLKQLGILKVGCFNKLKMDRTKWYSIDYEKLASYASGQKVALQEEEVSGTKESEEMKPCGQKILMEVDRLAVTIPETIAENTSEINTKTTSSCEAVLDFFANNFYLPKYYDATLIDEWCESYGSEMVLEAMKIAKRNNARSLNYMERILMNWKEEGVQRAEEIAPYLEERRIRMQQSKSIPILILDDIGIEQSKPWVKEIFYRVLDTRMTCKRITLITFNMPLEGLQYDARIISHLEKMVIKVQMPEEDIRRKLGDEEGQAMINKLLGL